LRPLTAVLAACVLVAGRERKQPPANNVATIRVTDDAGRAVELPRAATRIVSLMPTVTDLIIAMGHADRLIARTDYDLDTATPVDDYRGTAQDISLYTSFIPVRP
jgi:ABC-type Fe3+-hydroxamate transport system substrate-binding protein